MSSRRSILLGTHYHPGSPETLERQSRARATLRALPGVILVNLQFPDEVINAEGFVTLPQLLTDSVKASGRPGVRKPIGSEAFGRLAAAAREHGCALFGWVNSDVQITPAAIEAVQASPAAPSIFSRMNFDGATGKDLGMELGGLDAFFFPLEWWEAHAPRFRPYVNSESFWDPVYAAIALCHGEGHTQIHNRTGLIRHEMHPKVWRESPFAAYNQHLATLDTLYFQQWTRYRDRLCALRQEGASEDAERAWALEAFRWPPPLSSQCWHVGRRLREWVRNPRLSLRDCLSSGAVA